MESTVALAKYRREEEEEERLELPTGFRFHPRDEEIITYYLTPKVLNHGFSAKAMGEVDLNKCEPWDLPRKAKMGEKEWYFFCQKDKKYPTGMRTNRATETGYWKATGKDKEIYRGRGVLVGMKKTLVFYTGRAPRGGRTNWVMHEYRLEGKLPFSRDNNFLACSMDEWVVCKVFHKDVMATSKNKNPIPIAAGAPRQSNTNSFGFDATTQLHPIMNRICYHSNSTVWPAAAGQSFAAADHVDVAKLMALENLTFMLELDDPNLLFYHQALQSLPGPCTAPPSISTAGNAMMHGGGGPSAATSHHDLDGLLNELDSCSFDCSVLTCL